MTLTTFSLCLALLLLTLLLDLRVSRVLGQGMKTRGTRAVLALWPLQVLLHLVVFYFVASARPAVVLRPHITLSRRTVPGPFSPAFPPLSFPGKKERVEHL